MTTDLVQFNPDQLDLIKRTIAKDATNDELALFVHQCERTGLDPINKQIYFQKRSGRVTIITAIDGFRLIAQRTGQYAGGGKASYCGEDGNWKDIWVSATPPVAAKVVVKKVVAGLIVETEAVAHYSEYVVKYNGKPGEMWAKMPRNQLAKCAEALALRKAFPAELSGLYTAEEMAQADNDRGAGGLPVKDEARPADVSVEARPTPQPVLAAAPDNSNVDPATGVIETASVGKPDGVLVAGQRATKQRHHYDAPRPTSADNTKRIMADFAADDYVDKTAAKELLKRIGTLSGDALAAFNAGINAAGLTVPTTMKVGKDDYAKFVALLDGEVKVAS